MTAGFASSALPPQFICSSPSSQCPHRAVGIFVPLITCRTTIQLFEVSARQSQLLLCFVKKKTQKTTTSNGNYQGVKNEWWLTLFAVFLCFELTGSKAESNCEYRKSILAVDALCHEIIHDIREFINRPLSCQMKLVQNWRSFSNSLFPLFN